MKASDGKYHINGKKYDILEGSRAQVMHATAYKTSGGLTKSGLKYNKHDAIVSTKKSNSNPLARLTRAGYRTVKGKFGWVKDGTKRSKTRKTRKRKRKGRGSKRRGLFLHERRGTRGRYRRLG